MYRLATAAMIATLLVIQGCGLLERWRGEAGAAASAEQDGLAAVAASSRSVPSTASTDAGRPATHAAGATPCPAEMALIDRRFCIDRWEAMTENPDGSAHSPYHAVGTRPVQARSRAGVVPQGYISMGEADGACTRAGKRLCTTQQWLDACAGTSRSKRTYPYGMKAKPGACNVHRPIHPSSVIHRQRKTDSYSLNDPRLNQVKETIAKTGSFADCVTPEGVYDLQGNLLEWTRGAEPRPLLMGGYYLDGKRHGLGCRYVTDGHGPQYHDFSTGFRCCKLPTTQAPARPSAPPRQRRARRGSAPLGSAAAAPTASRDPPGMRSFLDPVGQLPQVKAPPYASPDAKCPVDMIYVEGVRCAAPKQRCLKWLPRRSVGQKIACAEFKAPSTCEGLRVTMRYCIDRLEFTPDGYTYPLTHVSWTEAQNLCRGMDKRLCFEDEWEFACEGPEAFPYPYGHVRDGRRCNHDFPERDLVNQAGEFVDRRVRAEALTGCASPFGVLGLVGNVDEWTTRRAVQSPRRAILRGGWWLIGRNRCRAATANHGERYAGMQTGFRCCRAAR